MENFFFQKINICFLIYFTGLFAELGEIYDF